MIFERVYYPIFDDKYFYHKEDSYDPHGTNGWYFYDETWAGEHGPYTSRAEAEKYLEKYIEYLETGIMKND